MDVNADEYTLKQLRAWLLNLKQPISGNKPTLALRLNAIPCVERGSCPNVENSNSQDDENEDGCDSGKLASGESASDNAAMTLASKEVTAMEWEAIKKELEIIKKERALLIKENELLKNYAVNKNARETVQKKSSTDEVSTTPFNVLKELLAEFDGSSNAQVWTNQFKNLIIAYELDTGTSRALLVTKLRGKAQQWLYTMPDYTTMKVEKLLEEIEKMFAVKDSQMTLRRKLEARKWQHSEQFSQYVSEKIMLANDMQMEETEIIEYIIDGIPDPYLRTQANILCVTSVSQLLKAYAKVELKSTMKKVDETRSLPQVRCFNCNSVGQIAASCKKPKREPGTCYGCGSPQHRVAECPERKKPIMMMDDDELEDYVRSFEFRLTSCKSMFFFAECLIDSGSPISFVKKKIVQSLMSKVEMNSTKYSYVGLNKSELKVYGKIKCFVTVKEKKIFIDLLVVANESMRYDAVLGRNFMNRCNIKLVYENYVKTNDCYENYVEDENVKVSHKKFSKSNFLTDYDKAVHEIFCIEDGILSDGVCLNIGDTVDEISKKEVTDKFMNNYVHPVRPDEPRVKCEMRLILQNEKPFHFSPRRLSYAEKEKLQKLLDEYLAKGYIRPSFSEYASAIVLVTKKTGDLRMCVDYRTLNKMTAKDNYPLPLIEDLIDKLQDKTHFTILDLKDGFFHVWMNEESIKYTSFVTPLGQFEWQRMPFGLKNAPSVFQRFVNNVFSDMIRQGQVVIYMDDILIATKGLTEHIEILDKVFKRMVENKLELRVDKCKFLQSKINYLGYVVTKDGIMPNDKGVESIKNFPLPTNSHEVQRFLGLASYFRKFIKDFSVIAKPLYDLIKKDQPFVFGEDTLKCFELIKNKLTEKPILAIYSPEDDTELHCDASADGFGAILLQKKKHDGKMHPIFYFSKRSTEVESKYHSFELETLAIIYALRRFRVYLHWKTFKIVTDCNSLTLTLNKKELNPRIARWALELQRYDYTLEHRPGTRMQHVDALSRTTNVLILEANTFEENLIICQGKDENLQKLRNVLETTENKLYELRNGVLYKKIGKDQILFYVPAQMEKHVLFKYHDEMGHSGVNKTIELIKQSYWFPEMKSKVENHISNCLKCISFNKNCRTEGFLHNIPKDTLPFDKIHIDHFGPVENAKRSKKHILVVIDASTKFVRLYPTKTTSTKEVIKAMKDYFRSYSRPKTIVSDRGSCFTSLDFQKFLKENNVQHIKVATGSPQANGQVERVNRSLRQMIAKSVEPDKGTYWDTILENVEFAMNNTLHRSVGQHPSVLLFGVNQRGNTVDRLKENFMEKIQKTEERSLENIREKAKTIQENAQKYNKNYVDRSRRRPKKFVKNDYVMVKNFDSQASGPKKLIPQFKGPYKVCKVLKNDRYLLKDVENFQQTQVPYSGVWAIANMRPWLGYRKG